MLCETIICNKDIDTDDRVIALNVKDYYLGISAKKGLERNLEDKGIKFEKKFAS